MGSIGRIVIEGHLGHSPELRSTASGKDVCNLRVAHTCGWGDRKGTWWVNVVVWGKLAPIVAGLSKGQRVIVDGRPSMRSWKTRDGEDREEMEIEADAVSWDSARAESPQGRDGYPQGNEAPPPGDGDIPF